MKKIVKYLVAAIAMVAAVSCQKELVEEKAPVKDGDSYVFTASLKPATKTVLNIDEETGVMKSQWWAGVKGKEYINVMDDREVNNKYASANLQEAADKTDFSLDEGADFYGTEVFAVYPYHANNAYWKGEEGEIGVVADFKQIQTATSGNYDPTAPVHVAYNPDITASTNLVFSNLSALVKFDVTTDFVRTITLSGLNGEMVSGPMVYKYANGKYTLEDNTDGYVEVTLTAAPYDYANGNGNAEQNYFAKGAHYLAIVPGTFEKGIQITLNAGLENPITFTHNDPITLRPGTVNDFGAFGTDKNLDWGVAQVGEEEKAHKLEYKDGYFVGTVALTKDVSYKIVASQEDYDASNYGLSFPREYAPVGKYDLATGEAGYEIRVDKTDEYYVMFSTGLSVLYLLAKGAADDEDLDLSKVATPDPVRTIKGTFVGEEVKMEPVKNDKDVTTHFEAVVEFVKSESENYSFSIFAGTTSYRYNFGCVDAETYEFADGVAFATKVNGDLITVTAPGYYVIQQSIDGSQVTVTTPETPDGAQWDFGKDAMMDFGVAIEDHFLVAEIDADAPEYLEGLYVVDEDTYATYKFVPTSLTSGYLVVTNESGTINDYMSYSDFDGTSFKATSSNLKLTDASATIVNDEHEIYVSGSPVGKQVIDLEGNMVYDFGYTLPGQLATGEYSVDPEGNVTAVYRDPELTGVDFDIKYTSLTSGVITYMGRVRTIEIEYSNPARNSDTQINMLSVQNGWYSEDETEVDEDGNPVLYPVSMRLNSPSEDVPAIEFVPFTPVEIQGQQFVTTYEDSFGFTYDLVIDLGYTFEGMIAYAMKNPEGKYDYLMPLQKYEYEEFTSPETGEFTFAMITTEDGHSFEVYPNDAYSAIFYNEDIICLMNNMSGDADALFECVTGIEGREITEEDFDSPEMTAESLDNTQWVAVYGGMQPVLFDFGHTNPGAITIAMLQPNPNTGEEQWNTPFDAHGYEYIVDDEGNIQIKTEFDFTFPIENITSSAMYLYDEIFFEDTLVLINVAGQADNYEFVKAIGDDDVPTSTPDLP